MQFGLAKRPDSVEELRTELGKRLFVLYALAEDLAAKPIPAKACGGLDLTLVARTHLCTALHYLVSGRGGAGTVALPPGPPIHVVRPDGSIAVDHGDLDALFIRHGQPVVEAGGAEATKVAPELAAAIERMRIAKDYKSRGVDKREGADLVAAAKHRIEGGEHGRAAAIPPAMMTKVAHGGAPPMGGTHGILLLTAGLHGKLLGGVADIQISRDDGKTWHSWPTIESHPTSAATQHVQGTGVFRNEWLMLWYPHATARLVGRQRWLESIMLVDGPVDAQLRFVYVDDTRGEPWKIPWPG